MTEQEQQATPEQAEMPFAVVQGTAITELPKDLYIPPEALEVFLAESFEGPLDLLLYLIKKQNLDILDIPIAEITRQYMEYVEVMKDIHLELAGEYLVMAAMLAEIKSHMLLPQPTMDEAEEGDPRAELVRRLQEYERFKQAADDINEMPRVGRDVFNVVVAPPDLKIVRLPPKVELGDVLNAVKEVMRRAVTFEHHHIQLEPLSVRERMSKVLIQIKRDEFVEFSSLFTIEEGRAGVIVTLLAILELLKQSLLEFVQAEPFAQIHVKAKSDAEH